MGALALRSFREDRRSVDLEVAPAGVLVVVSVGDPYRVGIGAEERIPAKGGFVVGPQSAYGTSELRGSAVGVQADLPWSLAAVLLGPQIADLADTIVPLTALGGGAQLGDRLNETPEGERAQLVGAWLRDRGSDRRAPSALTVRALQRIESGADSVDGLAAELGCSRGHLHRLVRAATGQSPSTLIRIVRLHRLLARRDGRTFADRAAAAGYADHAHLCHETRGLAGRTPRELFAAVT